MGKDVDAGRDQHIGHRVVGLDHLQIAIPPASEPTAIEFYGGLLGLTQLPKPTEMAGRGGAWFQAGPTQIHLGADPDFVPAKKAHPALVFTGIDSLVKALQAAGHDVREGLTVDGVTQIFTDDPFGNRIELIAA